MAIQRMGVSGANRISVGLRVRVEVNSAPFHGFFMSNEHHLSQAGAPSLLRLPVNSNRAGGWHYRENLV